MYKDKPFKMYKIFEEIYYSRDYDSIKAYHVLEEIANPFNKIMNIFIMSININMDIREKIIFII